VIQCNDTSDQHFFSFILKSCQQQNFLYLSIFSLLGGHIIFHSPSKLTMLSLQTSKKFGLAIYFSDSIGWLKYFVMTLIRLSEERIQSVPYRGGVLGGFKPLHPEIPKALQKRAKLNPIVKTVKNCWI